MKKVDNKKVFDPSWSKKEMDAEGGRKVFRFLKGPALKFWVIGFALIQMATYLSLPQWMVQALNGLSEYIQAMKYGARVAQQTGASVLGTQVMVLYGLFLYLYFLLYFIRRGRRDEFSMWNLNKSIDQMPVKCFFTAIGCVVIFFFFYMLFLLRHDGGSNLGRRTLSIYSANFLSYSLYHFLWPIVSAYCFSGSLGIFHGFFQRLVNKE